MQISRQPNPFTTALETVSPVYKTLLDDTTTASVTYVGKAVLGSATSAADIWTFPTTNLTTANTTGNQQKKMLTTPKFLGLK